MSDVHWSEHMVLFLPYDVAQSCVGSPPGSV